jgi:hypothetical protein
VIFFYQFFFFGKVPFPGDLLVAEYVPWKYETILGFNPGSFPNKAQYFDTIQQLYPWKQLVVSQISSGRIPLWNPYNFSGSPLLANIQSSVFNPVNILFFLFSMPTAWGFSVYLQCFIASVFMYLFARKLRLGVIPSLLSSVSYSYSLFMTVFLEYNTIGFGVALLPVALYCYELLREKRTGLRIVLFCLSVTLFFLVGHLQVAVVAYLFLLFYILFSQRLSFFVTQKKIYEIGFLILLATVIAGIQLVPSIELLLLSARVPQQYGFLVEKLLIQPWQFIMIMIPDIYGNPVSRNFIANETYPTKAMSVGVGVLLFSFIGFWQWKKHRVVVLFASALFIVLLFTTRTPFSEIFYRFPLPLFSTSSPSNMIFLSSFCLSILAGFGLQAWLRGETKIQQLLFFLLFVLGLLLLSFQQKEFYQEKNIFLSLSLFAGVCILFLIGFFKSAWSRTCSVVFLGIVLVESFFFFQKFNPFVPLQTVYPDTKITQELRTLTSNGDRFWSFGNAVMESNVQTQQSLYSAEGYDPLYPAAYGELLYATRDGTFPRSFDSTTRSNAVIAPQSSGQGSFLQNDARLRVLNLLSVKYILDRDENASSEKTFPETSFQRVFHQDGWSIYENKNAFPRARLVSSVVVSKDPEAFTDTVFDKDFDIGKTVILQSKINQSLSMKRGKVTQFFAESDRMLFKTKSDGGSVLALSSTFYPGWRVLIDGKEKELLQVNHALSGVFVPEGEHDVVFYYWPDSFVFGMYLTIIGIVILILYAWFVQKRVFHN